MKGVATVAGHELRVLVRRVRQWRSRPVTKWLLNVLIPFPIAFLIVLPICGFDDGMIEVLGWLVVIACCVAGPVLAAPCIVRERQRGSLDLLLLSRLGADDIVIGKLLARMVPILFGLVVVTLPVVGDSLLWLHGLGDWWNVLAISAASALGLSALGVACSSRCRTVGQAIGWAFGLTALLVIGTPLLEDYTYRRVHEVSCSMDTWWVSLAVSPFGGVLDGNDASILLYLGCYLSLTALGGLAAILLLRNPERFWIGTHHA